MAIGFPLFIPLIGADEGGLIGGYMVRGTWLPPCPSGRQPSPFRGGGVPGFSMTPRRKPRKGLRGDAPKGVDEA